MAQTKRKRRSTKHRGNAAGQVEVRGRTSGGGSGPKGKPGQRFDKPPEWRAAANRAAIAAIIFGVMLVLLFKRDPLPAAGMTAAVFVLYVPLGYYTDAFIYNRRQRKKQAANAAK
jgi:hypothetical protein